MRGRIGGRVSLRGRAGFRPRFRCRYASAVIGVRPAGSSTEGAALPSRGGTDGFTVRDILTALAGLVILILAAALIAPPFIPWEAYRSTFDAALGRSLGVEAQSDGRLEVRLLPSPRLRIDHLRLAAGRDKPSLDARFVKAEIALTPLLSGEIRFTETRIGRGEVTLPMTEAGSFLPLPSLAEGRDLAVEDLRVSQLLVTTRVAATGAPTRSMPRPSGSRPRASPPVAGRGHRRDGAVPPHHRGGRARRGGAGEARRRRRHGAPARPRRPRERRRRPGGRRGAGGERHRPPGGGTAGPGRRSRPAVLAPGRVQGQGPARHLRA